MAEQTVSLVLATSTGGVGTHVRSLARGLIAAGWLVDVCGPASTDSVFRFADVGARFRPVRISGGPRDLLAVPALRRVTAASAIVHAHGLRAASVAVADGQRPLVVTWHNAVLETSVARRRLSYAAERFVAQRATVSLAASDDLADHVRQLGGRDVRDGPVGVASASAARSADEVRAELGLRPEQHLVLSIGRLHPQKSLEVLIKAATGWPADQVLVAVAGDGPLRSTLAAQITAAAAPVRLLGRRTDIGDLLVAADVVVLPSRWEARSLAAQETLLAGRPLVATAVGGLPKLLGHGAVLVPPGDPDALRAAVDALLADPRRRADLAARGIEQAASWPTETDTAHQVSALYRELLG